MNWTKHGAERIEPDEEKQQSKRLLHITHYEIHEVVAERTTGATEAWNRILKQTDHRKHRLRPDVFIKEHYPILLGRQLSFVDDFKKPQKKKVMVSQCTVHRCTDCLHTETSQEKSKTSQGEMVKEEEAKLTSNNTFSWSLSSTTQKTIPSTEVSSKL